MVPGQLVHTAPLFKERLISTIEAIISNYNLERWYDSLNKIEPFHLIIKVTPVNRIYSYTTRHVMQDQFFSSSVRTFLQISNPV